MSDSYIQVRTNEADKMAASKILEELGTNTSAVVNMLLKQIIITRTIPFEIKAVPIKTEKKSISNYRVEDVKRLLQNIPDSVEEIWIFGSTVTEYCRPQSDLDVCVIGHTTTIEESGLYKAPKCAVDLITATPEEFQEESLIPGSVYKDVKEKGILVYKKGTEISWQ